jgi:hypothetical protein
MAIDQAPGRNRGPSATVCPPALVAGLHGSLLVSLVLAAAVLTWRGGSGALAAPPGAAWLLVVLLWSVIIAGESWWWLSIRRKQPARVVRQYIPHIRRSHSADDPSIVQESRRERGPGGQEQVAGWLRVDVAAGQRVAQVHVSFCPPLGQTPAIELRQVGGPAARLKLGQALAYGARFELKLAAPGPASISLEYTATTAGATTAGAAGMPTIPAEGATTAPAG